MPRFAVDTNVLAYSEGIERVAADGPKIDLSRRLVRALIASGAPWVVSVQALAELHHVLTRRGGSTASEASVRTRRLAAAASLAPSDSETFELALELADVHRLQVFDALILAGAMKAGADVLLTEDLHDGFGWRGVTVINPFQPALDVRLVRLLGARP